MKKLVFTIIAVLIVVLSTGCQITLVQPAVNPTAYIDKISPPSAAPGEKITFEGHGTDPDGTVVAYRWSSSIDGDLSTDAKFDTKLSPGTHTISLKVQDNNGNWSPEATSSIAISGGAPPPAPTPTPTPPPAGSPVISYFIANPANIAMGNSSTLSWSVTGASAFVIDHGIGSVGATGTMLVTPGATTTYTLTATGPGGSAAASTVVAVTAGPPTPISKPDLVVTGITHDGTMIKYTILNQGTANAGPSNSRLFIDGAEKATDGVAALAAGASRTESFSYSYECSGTSDLLVVQVDKDSMVDESNEANNSFSTTWTCFFIKEPILFPGTILVIKPDLVIIDIYLIGSTMYYKIKNQGNSDSGTSSSRLMVNGVHKADDTVAALAAGQERIESFAGYSYPGCTSPPSTIPIQVQADQGGAVNESNEGNNLRTENWPCTP